MRKNNVIRIFIIIILIALAFGMGMVVEQWRQEAKRSSAVQVDAANVKEGIQKSIGEYVKLMPGTTAEMLDPAFWKTETSQELLFTPEEIEYYQNNNPISVLYYDEAAGRSLRFFVDDLPEEIDGRSMHSLINLPAPEDAEENVTKLYVNGSLPEKGYWEALRNNCALDAIPEKVVPKYGICIKRTVAMGYPTEDFASSNPSELFCNDFVSAEIMPLSGVAILHESLDKTWVYVINGSYCGWIKKENLAMCKDKEEWLAISRPQDFLVVTGCEVLLDESALPNHTAGMVLPMGTRIKLLSKETGQIAGREGYGCYLAEIPYREEDGMMGLEKVWIPVAKDVTVGFLPMTSDAVIEQAFKFQGKIYGWGGSFSSNDCSGMVRQVYACFGFELPRNSSSISELYDLGGTDFFGATEKKKLETLKKLPTGTLLYMDGHLMIYLGMVEEKPYVISSCATFIAPGDGTGNVKEAYGVFVSNMDLLRKNGKTWLDSFTYFQWKDY